MMTKLNELLDVLCIMDDKVYNKKISIEDAQYALLIINKYLDILEK